LGCVDLSNDFFKVESGFFDLVVGEMGVSDADCFGEFLEFFVVLGCQADDLFDGKAFEVVRVG